MNTRTYLLPVAGLALLVVACGGTTPTASTSSASPTSGATVSASGAPTVSASVTPSTASPSGTAAACSAAGLGANVAAQTGLPAAVAAMRVDLARAAASCDYAELARLADRNGKAVRFSFGAETDAAAYWQAEERHGEGVLPMRALRTLLGLPYGAQRLPNGDVIYVWPAAFASEHPADAELEEVADSGLYSMSTLREWVRTGNNYLGYRVLIGQNGDWMAFVAGD